jgi:hypothetical protein
MSITNLKNGCSMDLTVGFYSEKQSTCMDSILAVNVTPESSSFIFFLLSSRSMAKSLFSVQFLYASRYLSISLSSSSIGGLSSLDPSQIRKSAKALYELIKIPTDCY